MHIIYVFILKFTKCILIQNVNFKKPFNLDNTRIKIIRTIVQIVCIGTLIIINHNNLLYIHDECTIGCFRIARVAYIIYRYKYII